jgi:2-polyprenyl-6-methoxyphenol hydroxylase-like FAD-dependent oxidoreductase
MIQSEGYTGHVGVISHKQPALEKHLRSVIKGSQHSQLRSRCTLKSIEEDEDCVYASYVDPEGNDRRIRARFLVGADGKTGYVRKQYLEPRGIKMEWAEQYVFSHSTLHRKTLQSSLD